MAIGWEEEAELVEVTSNVGAGAGTMQQCFETFWGAT